jgi:predicted DNA-binding transcriptional regulator YafY
MSVRQTIKRHFKIISLLRLKPLSFEEIQDEFARDPDAMEENLQSSQRTFQRDIRDIASIYNIEIQSDRSSRKYHIVDDVEGSHSQRLRENFELLNAIRLSKSLGNQLIFEERKPLGTEHLAGILHAIQNRTLVKFQYLKYWDASRSNREVKPLALKEARNRWYLIGVDTKDEIIKNFSLDRMQDLQLSSIRFTAIPYNAYEEFKDSFGIINGTGEEACEVILEFSKKEGQYIESLPLHHSQELIQQNKNGYRFKYFIRPTYDFRMEILSYGNQVEVVQPDSLRVAIRTQLKDALKAYQ